MKEKMKEKTQKRILWEERLIERIEKTRPRSITTPDDMDISEYGYLRAGKGREGRIRWEEETFHRTRSNNYYHLKHPNATYYYKQ